MATVASNKMFDDEPLKPSLSNLATHVKEHAEEIQERKEKGKDIDKDEGNAAPVGKDRGFNSKSCAMMKAFVAEGILHPAVKPTQEGFNTLFSAFLLCNDLPFTTGESEVLRDLFKYISCHFKTPTDTTVRRHLERIVHPRVV